MQGCRGCHRGRAPVTLLTQIDLIVPLGSRVWTALF